MSIFPFSQHPNPGADGRARTHAGARRFGLALSVVLAAAAVLVLSRFVSWSTVAASLAHARPKFLLMAGAAYLVANLSRAVRFDLLLRIAHDDTAATQTTWAARRTSFRHVLGTTFVHTFLSNNLPARSGELSYVLLLRREKRLRGSAIVSSLVLARLFDMLVVGIFAFAGWFAVRGALPASVASVGAAIAVAAVPAVILILFLFLHQAPYAALRSVAAHIPFIRQRLLGWMDAKAGEISSILRRARSAHVLLPIACCTLFIWTANFLFIWSLFLGSSVPLSYGESVFVYAFPIAAGLFPIQPVANVGPYEASIVAALLLLGRPSVPAVAAAVAVHLENFAFSLLFAFIGYLVLIGSGSHRNKTV